MSAPTVIEGQASYAKPDFDALDAIFRLFIGVSAEGVDQFFARLKRWEDTVYDPNHFAGVAADETPVDQLRYLFVGILYRSQRQVRRRSKKLFGITWAVAQLGLPVLQRVRDNWLVEMGLGLASAEIERLIGEGRLQEKNARSLSRHVLGSTIDEIVRYLTANPTMTAMLSSQLAKLDSTALDELAEGIVRKLAKQSVH